MNALFPIHTKNYAANFSYNKDREKLIPFAVKVADAAIGPHKKGGALPDEQANLWNYTFHTEMERLVRQEGIVK